MGELYVLPEGWEWKKLGDVLSDIKTGTTPPKKEQKYYDNPSINWFSPSDFGEHKELIEAKNKINGIAITDKKAKIYQANSLLLVAIGATVGKIGIARDQSSSNQQITAMNFNENIDIDFSYYWLVRIKEIIIDTASAATLPIINQKVIKSLPFPLPPLKEQKRIVAKLDSLFAKIDQAITLHQQNIDEADAFMGSVLNEVFGELEEKYPKKRINEISIIKGGKRVPKGYKLSEDMTPYPYLRVTDFTVNGTISTEKMLYLSEEIYRQIQRYTITDKDLYITNVGNTIGKSGIVPPELNGANLTENAVKLVYKDQENTSNKYMYYFTKSSNFITQMESATKQMAVPKLAIMRLGEIIAPFPPLKTQQKTVQYLDQLSQKTEMLKQVQHDEMQSLKALKASILDRAFRGKL